MSAESFDECEMGESLMVKQSYHLKKKKKKKLSLFVFSYFTHLLNTLQLKRHPFIIPVNLSLLNHSNLFP